MKKTPTIKIILLFITGVIVLISCRKDIYGPKTASDIQWAQDYYNNVLVKAKGNQIDYKKFSKMPTIQETKEPNVKTALWDKAVAGNTGIYDFVEMPLLSTRKISTYIGPQGDTANLDAKPESFDRLVVYKNKSGTINQRIVTYVPAKSYLDRHNGDASQNTLNKLDKDFTGYLVYKDWEGMHLFTLAVNNGKPRKFRNATQQPMTGTKKTDGNMQLNSFTPPSVKPECNYIFGYNYMTECTHIGYVTTECHDEIVNIWIIQETCPVPEPPKDPDPEPQPDPEPEVPLDCSDPVNYENGECIQPQPGGNDGPVGGVVTAPPVRDIRNKTNDPCISKTVQDFLSSNKNIVGEMSEVIKKFDNDKTININIYDGAIPFPGLATNQKFIGNEFSADITLNVSYHANTSQENLITTLIHEIVHAYLGYTSNNFLKTETDHNVIADKYVGPMANYLHNSFGIPLKDAYALGWSGVQDSKVYKDAGDDTEFTMSDGNKITKAETRNLSGPYKLPTNDPSNTGLTKGQKICE
jgi:hypothetical protein